MSIRFGIIGHGFMGHVHENMLVEMEGAQVTAVCDINEEQLDDVREGITRYRSAEALLQDPHVDTVIIAANNNQHRDLVLQAARAGKDIICEKPAAMSVSEFDEMLRVVGERGVRLTVHQQRRYDPDFRTAKEILDRGVLGSIYTVKSSLYGYNGNMHDWHVLISEGGGMLYDWGVHLLDQMLWMINGKVKAVWADLRNVINAEVDDYFKILLSFENGITAEIELGTYYLSDKPRWFERHWFLGGNQGSAYIDGFEPDGKIVRTTELLHNVTGRKTMTAAGPTRSFGPPRPGLIVTEPLPEVHTEHRDFFRNYMAARKGEQEYIVGSPEVRRVLALMDAVRESAKTGRSVDFE